MIENISKIANHYLSSSENDFLLKKYIIFVLLTINNNNLRQKVLNKAKTEQNTSINRLVNFIEGIDKYKNIDSVKRFLKKDKIYIYFHEENNFKIEEKYSPIRAEILKDLINIYSDSSK